MPCGSFTGGPQIPSPFVLHALTATLRICATPCRAHPLSGARRPLDLWPERRLPSRRCRLLADGFDWRAQEAPQRLPAVQDRAARDRPSLSACGAGKGPGRMPLLLTHGWPRSVFKFIGFLPRLTPRPSAATLRRPAFAARLRPVVPGGPAAGRKSRIASDLMTAARMGYAHAKLLPRDQS